MTDEIIDRLASVFKAAWHEADARGETGHRVEAGIRAVIDAGGGPDHIIVVKGSAWTLRHPITERFEGDLFTCRTTQLVQAIMANPHPDERIEDGKHRVWTEASTLLWEEVPRD